MIWLMISFLLTGTVVLTVCVAYCIVKLKSNPLERYVRRLLSCAVGVTLFNVSAMLIPNETASLTLFALYNIFETLTVISLLSFIQHYIGRNNGLDVLRIPIFAVFAIDSILLLINPFHRLTFSVHTIADDFDNTFYCVDKYEGLYTLHTALITFMIVIVMVQLFHKMIISPRAYIVKYSSLFITICALVCLSFLHLYFNFQFDYSIGLYALEGFLIFYFSLIYIPRGLMDRLMFFTVACMKDGIICVDIDGNVVYANTAAIDFCAADGNVNTLEEQIKLWKNDEVNEASTVNMWETLRKIDNEKHYFTVEYRRIYDTIMKNLGSYYLIHDKTEEFLKYENEKFRATHDKLTGLYNKEFFYEAVEALLKENPNEDYNIIVTDVKNFKIVNDVFGDEVGDKVLKEIADITRKFGRSYCIYARLTGDRFALCIPEKRYSEETLLAYYSMADSSVENSSFKIHIHIGVYRITDRDMRVSVMCDHAMLAIRTIKDSFRNHVAYYKTELRESFIGDHRIISEFETAIANSDFRPYIQPQIASNGCIRGGEMLVRWFHPTDGIIRPDKFIKLLEQTGLISRLDKYMWELACKQLRIWDEQGYKKSYISVNISQKDFYLLDVYNVITSLMYKYGIEPSRLHLEVTETAIMDDPTNHLVLISRLRKRGFIVEIDDFGSGYSSLNMLKDFDADVLKIDMGFLRKTTNAEKSTKILRMIISLAKSLDMQVITEGVEKLEQVEFLTRYGCDIFQGFYFAKPVPVKEFEEQYLNKRFRMK